MKQSFLNIFWRKYTILAFSALLFVFSLFFNTLYSNDSSVYKEVTKAEKYLSKNQQDFSTFLKDTLLISKLVVKKETLNEFEKVAAKPYGIFLYTVNDFGDVEMKFWSEQIIVPTEELLSVEEGEYFRKLANGWYYIIKKTLNSNQGKLFSFAMIPIHSNFFIETEYLPETFSYSKISNERVRISENPTEFSVKAASGKTIFYLDKKTSGAVPYNNKLTIILRFCAVLLLLLFIQLFVESVARKKGIWKAIAVLVVSLVSLRLVIYFFPLLLNLRQFEFFSPLIYGSNIVQRSLGDLFINVILFGWIVIFAWSKLHDFKFLPTTVIPKKVKWLSGLAALCLLVLSTFVLASVIRSLVADSKISFDVTNFFSLNRYTLAGFFILAGLSLSYYYLSQLLFKLIFPLLAGKDFLIYFDILG